MRHRHLIAVQFAPTPAAGLYRAKAERRAGPQLRGVDYEMRLRRQVMQRRAFEQEIVKNCFEQCRSAGEAMEWRSDFETLEMSRQRSRHYQASDFQKSLGECGTERDDADYGEGGDNPNTQRTKQLADHRYGESLGEHAADFRLE